MLLAACLLALTQDTYAEAFDRGLAALEAGDAPAAVAAFEEAGERAPLAPLWRRYREHALGGDLEAVSDPELPELPGRWELLGPSTGRRPVFSPRGDRLVSGSQEVVLWDVPSGLVVARLSPRGLDRAGWHFDRSGRFLIGAPLRGQAGIDVRSARTGMPLKVRGATRLAANRGTVFEFLPGEPAPLRPGNLRYRAEDLAVPGGVLRAHTFGVGGNEDVAFDLAAGRALLHSRSAPYDTKLIDLDARDPLFELPLKTGASPKVSDGLGLVAGWEKLLVLDLATGERLPVPGLPDASAKQLAGACLFDGRLWVLTAEFELLDWDPRTGEELSRVALEDETEGLYEVQPLDGGRLVMIAGYRGVQVYERASGRLVWRQTGGRLQPGAGLWPEDAEAAAGPARYVAGEGPQVLSVADGQRVPGLPSPPCRSATCSPCRAPSGLS